MKTIFSAKSWPEQLEMLSIEGLAREYAILEGWGPLISGQWMNPNGTVCDGYPPIKTSRDQAIKDILHLQASKPQTPSISDNNTPANKVVVDRLFKARLRIFKISLDSLGTKEYFFIHSNKPVREWRDDIKQFKDKGVFNIGGHAECEIENNLIRYLEDLGYVEMSDAINDVFEGRIATEQSRLVDDPDHEEQKDGFGHYGSECDQK